MATVLATAALLVWVSRPRPGPPPSDIADDRLLVVGREVFLDRCISCHGRSGRGDGPIARSLAGPPPGDLADHAWKHGNRPEQVLVVVGRGLPNTAMPGWSTVLSPAKLRAVCAYVYYLAGEPVPPALRSG
jgi:cytochrome c oxidase cbb3-type subunit 3